MSNPIADVLKAMTNHSVTLGWDVVVAYDASSVNDLFAQQYVQNVAADQDLPPITTSLSPAPGVTVKFVDLTLGPPLISFNAGLAAQDANVEMSFVSGQVVTLAETTGGDQYLTGLQTVMPGDQLALQMVVTLAQVTGQVKKQVVTADLKNASSFKAHVVGGTTQAVYLGQYFQTLFSKAPSSLEYELGTIVTGTGTADLVPASFDIQTQAGSGSGSEGAVLLFVATTYNPGGGNLPGAKPFPNLIPDGFGTAVIVGSKTLFGNIIEGHYKSTLKGAPTFTVDQVSGTSPSSYLVFTGGGADIGVVKGSTDPGGPGFYSFWSGTQGTWMLGNPGYQNVVVPYQGLTVAPGNDALTLNWTNTFSQRWTGSYMSKYGGQASSSNLDLTISAKLTAGASVSAADEVSFSGSGGTPSITFAESSWFSMWGGKGALRNKAGFAIADEVKPVLGQVVNLDLPQVNAFSVSHLLFPSDNALALSAAHVPGDLALFGKIQPSQTAFAVAPLQATLAPKQTQKFSVSGGQSVKWTINPQIGTIAQDGTYTAPSVTAATTVVVTAKATSGGALATGVVTVVPSPLAVSPAFALGLPGQTQEFVAAATGGVTPTLGITPNDGSMGTLADGLYTPPATIPKGVNAATITAAAAGSPSATAIVLLVSADLGTAVTPQYATLGPGQTQSFSAGTAGYGWSVLPAGAGTVTSAGLYTAPATIAAPATAVVVGQVSAGGVTVANYAVVQLVPSVD